MAKKKASTRSMELALSKPRSLADIGQEQLATAIGRHVDPAKIAGDGGEIVREEGVVLISGRDYATSDGIVPAAEIYFAKESVPREQGPWLGEADKVSWVDPATGLECIMLRDHPRGFLSGYVGVGEGHPLFGWSHKAVPADLGIEVHGGLAYSRTCDDGPSPELRLIREFRRICHVVFESVPLTHATEHRVGEGQWWFGFNCNRVYDVVPARLLDRQSFTGAGIKAVYRDDAYVVREIRSLAAQLAAIRDGRSVPPRDGPPLPPIGLDRRAG